ncbi:MAG: DUF1697 domain-containing protein [Alphaproteobacteria bacterium]|nr:DUF1697 domain-containing protein [Alphaproteobacteria bacterium]
MRYAALLRAVNVGGRKVTMAELRSAAADLGFSEVQTLLASGNLVFETKATPAGSLERKLEAAIDSTFGLFSDVMVRDPGEWKAILEANPFPEKASRDPAHLVCMVCKETPDAAVIATYLKSFRQKHDKGEQLKIVGREIFIDYGASIGQSKLLLPKKAATGTARNWNTMLKLGEMLGL